MALALLNIRTLCVLAMACGLTPMAAQAQSITFTTLYSFGGYSSDGAYPYAGLVADASGALYGTTLGGGSQGAGSAFKLTPPTVAGAGWTESIVYSFTGRFTGDSDGGFPEAGLIADASGALYGTTTIGGGSFGGNFTYGTVFKLTPPATVSAGWTETLLHSFSGGSDGFNPYSGLIADASGALYGTTANGGLYARGTVFKLTPPSVAGAGWTETVLYYFTGGSDGGGPYAGLIADASGALYGTNIGGGSTPYGAVFKLELVNGSWTNTTLYRFTGGSDGGYPYGGLIADASGALYGTTLLGGSGYGTVFKLAPPSVTGAGWTETVLYRFTGGNDGANPVAAMISDASGALYGTTTGGGSGYGTVFKLAPPSVAGASWTETVLYRFTGGNDGGAPYAGLIADASGGLYGTTVNGGTNGSGTVFKLTVPATFVGVPGQTNCTGQSFSTVGKKYGGMAAAAKALGYTDVQALQSAITSYCGG